MENRKIPRINIDWSISCLCSLGNISSYLIMVNKYQQNAEYEIDLHGYTTSESKDILDSLLQEAKYNHVRIIVGKGNNSENGPILPSFVMNYLKSRNIRYNQSKIQDGGEGALEVFLGF